MVRLLVFDRTAPGLCHAWRAGAVLYRRLGRIDAAPGQPRTVTCLAGHVPDDWFA